MRHGIRILAAAGALALAGCSQIGAAEPGPAGPPGIGSGRGYGGYGPGSGMMGRGSGMMGPGYGMMGPGYGMNPDYGGGGPGNAGPGYGMGPGHGMGPGMMGGWRGLPPDLTPEQRKQIAEIQREQRSRQWPLMQQMHELMWADDSTEPGAFDEQAQRRNYDRLAGLRKQMFENQLEARKRIEAVLTPQQREQLRRGWGGVPR